MKTRERAFDAVSVNPVVGVQTAANRFYRPGVEKEIAEHIAEKEHNYDDDLESVDDMDSEDEDGGAHQAESDDESDDEESMGNLTSAASDIPIPRFARWRCNLTAISQIYNLYFVAYRGKIHVYVPQNAPQVLREAPALVLKPPPSPVGSLTRGHCNPSSPHRINNMIVGELGDIEVLVAAFDDGDVLAYYTHSIATVVEHNSRRSKNWTPMTKPPKEFFHSAVGASAWGLAVHKRSRLIAVSCNLSEITVYAFALNPAQPSSWSSSTWSSAGGVPRGRVTEPRMTTQLPRFKDDSPMLGSSLTAMQLERHMRDRTRNWRVILSMPILGHRGPNIPCVAFCEDEHGNADKIVAGDTNGCCWIFEIWKLGAPAVRLVQNQIPSTSSTVWGVLVLPDQLFKEATTAEEFVGMDPIGIDGYECHDGRAVIDITSSATLVPQNPTSTAEMAGFNMGHRQHHIHRQHQPDNAPVKIPSVFPKTPQSIDNEFGSADEDDDDDGEDVMTEPPGSSEHKRWAFLGPDKKEAPFPPESVINLEEEKRLMSTFTMSITPSSGFTYSQDGMSPKSFLEDFLLKYRDRQKYTVHAILHKEMPASHSLLPPSLGNRFSILCTRASDIELISPDINRATIRCRQLIEKHNPEGLKEAWDMVDSQRLCMVHCIPELGVVVAGSACGRVALLRLTKARNGGSRVRHGFRVEWILPRTSEEDTAASTPAAAASGGRGRRGRGVRPQVWMVGMAVSPVPQPGARGVELFPSSALQPGGSGELLHRGRHHRSSGSYSASASTSPSSSYKPIPRWRLIMYYMDHTVLTYTIEGSNPQVDEESSLQND